MLDWVAEERCKKLVFGSSVSPPPLILEEEENPKIKITGKERSLCLLDFFFSVALCSFEQLEMFTHGIFIVAYLLFLHYIRATTQHQH